MDPVKNPLPHGQPCFPCLHSISADSCNGRSIETSKDTHVLVPRICEHAVPCGKVEGRLQWESGVPVGWPENGEIYLGLFKEPTVIRKVFKSGRGRQKGGIRGTGDHWCEASKKNLVGFEDVPQDKECGKLPAAGKDKKKICPRAPERRAALQTHWLQPSETCHISTIQTLR